MADTSLPRFTARRILEVTGKKASLGDALVISAVLDTGFGVLLCELECEALRAASARAGSDATEVLAGGILG